MHTHTWYANTAGLLASLVHGAPHVVTAHSLEPRRPWKADQLGGGYRLSSWVERTAYLAADAVIAVSHGMRADVLDAYPDLDPARVHVVGNGVDAEAYRPVDAPDVVRALGVDPDRPYALFVGRITRQKGVMHLLAAAEQLPPDVGLVLCAGAPDTPAERQQVADAVAALQARRSGVVWIEAMLPREQLVPLITAATVFVVPVGLRAARHRQPGGGRLRHRRRRQRRRRHPGGRRRRPHRPARCPTTRPTRRRSSAGLAAADRRAGRRPRARHRDGRGRAGSGCSPSSAGRRSPSRPSRSTPASSTVGADRAPGTFPPPARVPVT